MTIFLKNKHTLEVNGFYFKCCIGKNGISKRKKEGDKRTPKGTFNIQHLYYRKDKLIKPKTSLKCVEINKNMGWCDDINAKNKYNKLITIKNDISCEKLYRNDFKYDLFIPIKYNFKNNTLGKGSCIFIHLTKNYQPTAGCIALQKKDFLILLRLINKNTRIKIY
jgi:L,D-peptidoglycan transpeptidase YkuD (ErfK/YbiS/YcfS/YnhG family)